MQKWVGGVGGHPSREFKNFTGETKNCFDQFMSEFRYAIEYDDIVLLILI